MKKKNRRRLRVMAWLTFILYLFLMVYFLFFCEKLGRVPSDTYHYNLKPFTEIKRYTCHVREIGWFGVSLNLIGNVVCFMPLGFVLPILFSRKWGLFQIVSVSCFTSGLIELLQLITKLGSCDVDDIIMNTLGGLLGYILFLICNRIYRGTRRKR